MADEKARGFRSAMKDATQDYKRRLRASVSDQDYQEIANASIQILRTLPPSVKLGNLAAALMLAATAFAEGGSQADRLIEEEQGRK
jgi:hypothetical protein